jgi:hypothetical protein
MKMSVQPQVPVSAGKGSDEGLQRTQGPWVEFADGGNTIALMPAGRPGDVCKFAAPYPNRGDARMMKASPEMLAALLLVARGFQSGRLKDQTLIDGLSGGSEARMYSLSSVIYAAVEAATGISVAAGKQVRAKRASTKHRATKATTHG